MYASKFTKFKFIVRNARIFPGIWFEFMDPHNSSLFFATPQIYVAADKNKIYNPVLFWNKHLPTCIFTRSYPTGRSQESLEIEKLSRSIWYGSRSSVWLTKRSDTTLGKWLKARVRSTLIWFLTPTCSYTTTGRAIFIDLVHLKCSLYLCFAIVFV